MDSHSIHNLLIILHAASATISFFAGFFLILFLSSGADGRLFGLYWATLLGMVVLLAGAILVYWVEYSNTERIIFLGLFVLGVYMLYRARSAKHSLKSQQADWKRAYIEHIGFTLISLFEGFVIVSGLTSGFRGWVVGLLAILGVLIGRWLIGIAQERVEKPLIN
jgi:hypothetical protein